MCQKIYFPTEDFSAAFVTMVNAGLWSLFHNFGERDLHQHGLDDLQVERARAICKRNLDEAARSTPLLLERSYTQIHALLLLVYQALSRREKHRLTENSRHFY